MSIRKLRTKRDDQQWIFGCHHYIIDWLSRALLEDKTNNERVAYVTVKGDGLFGDCESQPPVGPGEAYF
ncbi:MAG: hypothetical protein QF605_05990 [Rhodospirillales bacterium]|nr:hypothetical protein [Rhodospirillales bacterium]